MTKITGRPPEAIKQEKFIGYFVTNEQHAIIQEKAEQAKVNISDYMRQSNSEITHFCHQRPLPVQLFPSIIVPSITGVLA